ncbi:hypothetical protein RAB80_014864 [Fusarium oxysporum f. sp. vasinfectum]|nr:hypothetical protein RAB80_014864 [Fusarium oxysporum f. sp. vasinfectum]KAK2690860.1 hypothetical protein QWA68_010442 [Fusarium oxysporum]KAK2924898.1 hypothetical protein FoTM2_015176 [Fusarium oxysporum f. sp. vasinfectum]
MDSYDDFQSTPTGKVSKAKKGKPVHVCSECQKVYTRAEHLRYNFSTYISDKESMLTRQQAASVFAPRAPVRMPIGSTIEDRAANMWSLPIALISRHSPYMEAMSPGSGIFPKAHINLLDADPAVFGLFVEWLYNGTYTDFTSPSSSNIHARCWGLGDELLCNEFKNYVMGQAESRDSSVGALSLKQESPGGNESEPVQASVSCDDNKLVCLSLEKATTPLQTVESKEYTEG